MPADPVSSAAVESDKTRNKRHFNQPNRRSTKYGGESGRKIVIQPKAGIGCPPDLRDALESKVRQDARPQKPNRRADVTNRAQELRRSYASTLKMLQPKSKTPSKSDNDNQKCHCEEVLEIALEETMESARKKSPSQSLDTVAEMLDCVYSEPWIPGKGKDIRPAQLGGNGHQANGSSRASMPSSFRQQTRPTSDGHAKLAKTQGFIPKQSVEKKSLMKVKSAPPPVPDEGPLSSLAFDLVAEGSEYLDPLDLVGRERLTAPPVPQRPRPVVPKQAGSPSKPGMPLAAPKRLQLVASKLRSKSAVHLTHNLSQSSGTSQRDSPDLSDYCEPWMRGTPVAARTVRRASTPETPTPSTPPAQQQSTRARRRSHGAVLDTGGPATTGSDGIFFGSDFQLSRGRRDSISEQGGYCCPASQSIEILLTGNSGARIVDGIPDTPGLRRHVGMASQLEDLLELMLSNGWHLSSLRKTRNPKAKKKVTPEAPLSHLCVFVKCGCKGNRASSPHNGSVHSQTGSSGRGSIDIDVAAIQVEADEESNLDRIPAHGARNVTSRLSSTSDAALLLRDSLSTKEAAELQLLLNFFNINVPIESSSEPMARPLQNGSDS